MKKLLRTLFICCALWSGIQLARMDTAFAQTSMVPSVLPNTNLLALPLTNGLGFTNTLVPVTNLSHLQLSNVVTLLLSLQTNVEQVLPVLANLTSNATFEAAAGPVSQPVVPLTTNAAGALVPSTGQVAGAVTQLTTIAAPLGTNIIEIDPGTFQGLVSLRDDLELALPVLQMLNGTAPSTNNTNHLLTPTGFTNPIVSVTNFPIIPLSQPFTTPLTNGSHITTIPSPF